MNNLNWHDILQEAKKDANYIYLSATNLLYLCYQKIWIESNFLKTKKIN